MHVGRVARIKKQQFPCRWWYEVRSTGLFLVCSWSETRPGTAFGAVSLSPAHCRRSKPPIHTVRSTPARGANAATNRASTPPSAPFQQAWLGGLVAKAGLEAELWKRHLFNRRGAALSVTPPKIQVAATTSDLRFLAFFGISRYTSTSLPTRGLSAYLLGVAWNSIRLFSPIPPTCLFCL